MTRAEELKSLLHQMHLSARQAATLLSLPKNPITSSEILDFVTGRRYCPGWVLSALEYELLTKNSGAC